MLILLPPASPQAQTSELLVCQPQSQALLRDSKKHCTSGNFRISRICSNFWDHLYIASEWPLLGLHFQLALSPTVQEKKVLQETLLLGSLQHTSAQDIQINQSVTVKKGKGFKHSEPADIHNIYILYTVHIMCNELLFLCRRA